MTSLASANGRASLELLSYSWGSALGSVTTLCTVTFVPPSWAAMLPQKFSPATTVIAVPDCTEAAPPHAEQSNKPTRSTAHLPIAQEHRSEERRVGKG